MMSPYEKHLVENHLYIVNSILARKININESASGLGYWDLYQTGCLSLCKAAMTYQPSRGASFKTYAYTVIYNDLMGYCKQAHAFNSRLCPLDAPIDGVSGSSHYELLENQAMKLYEEETTELFQALTSIQEEYKGISQKGIEALLLKCQGYSGVEIARYYGVKPNHVAAWITRACKKLKTDSRILEAATH